MGWIFDLFGLTFPLPLVVGSTFTIREIFINGVIRTAACGASVTGFAIGLSACSDPVDPVDRPVSETYVVTYEVTGRNVDSIGFRGGRGKAVEPKTEMVSEPELSWTKTVVLRGIMSAAIMPIAADIDGRITYKGKVFAEQSAVGSATAGGCMAKSSITG
ncbi:hypothetical protein ACIQPR_29685 [Streptomyces sp. NPDC091280]|uniref:hypothetical protein n=1 Tax=Streptomyces sp. NPDC091280 TaxID=3365984 RepID=UPI0037FC4AFF